MKGLELNRKFAMDVVINLINEYFPFLADKYAIGLIGYGSDVLGYDDEISRDHEWGPRCQVWLSEDHYKKYGKEIDKMLSVKLPLKFLGYYTRYKVDNDIPVLVPSEAIEGSMHHVALTTVWRYLKIQYEIESEKPTYIDWLCLPEQKLLELTRGKIFYDPIGDISLIREKFNYLPEEVWCFKLMYTWMNIDHLEIVGLCGKRGDILSAKLALHKIVDCIIRLTFLLNRKYCPGTPKWISKEFYNLPRLATEIGEKIESCLMTNDIECIVNTLEEVFLLFLREHNRLQITSKIQFDQVKLSRGITSFSLRTVVDALNKKLPAELQNLEMQGACDQWITNSNILIWSEQYAKFKEIYKCSSNKRRDNIGDMII
ncbi:DUF4037 domain-containing protein [Tepidibacter sp. Z1-5]|uniref:DUF4037 domain-containing protein n=1 Tax=Tepidibacter sp. Z1-5 TaxID=3134138 RepID=UPI0030BBF230